jgi:YD repeat-containing protein
MLTDNDYLQFRNTYYWDRTACALAYRDYSKARLYHFSHTDTLGGALSGSLESMKPPLEGRVWYDYAGQTIGNIIGSNTAPTHIGRVLDDGTTQLYSYAFNAFGHVTNSVDPAGRTFSYIYDTNGVDLLEVRQTRTGNNELIAKATYNSQHLPLTVIDASGQAVSYSYNARGQILMMTNPKNETSRLTYDTNGYLIEADGALPGTNDRITADYDAFGRVQNMSDVSGYIVTFAYDNLNRVTSMTHPDGTSTHFNYDRLDCASIQDRAGRQTLFEHDNVRHLTKKTDPLGRVTLFEWCRCGSLKSLTDPMGRKTSWVTDVQGRRIAKQYGDGSQVQYLYANTSGRLLQVVDEKQQFTIYAYNPDNSVNFISYGNTAIATPSVGFTYDPNYARVVSMTDGIGTTLYNYYSIAEPPVLGAGRVSSVAGPLPNDVITCAYDELGRRVQTSIDGVVSTRIYDAASRITGASNALGSFTYAYDGSSLRVVSQSDPNGQTATINYGSSLQDFSLQQITYAVGPTPISQFSYGRDVAR